MKKKINYSGFDYKQLSVLASILKDEVLHKNENKGNPYYWIEIHSLDNNPRIMVLGEIAHEADFEKIELLSINFYIGENGDPASVVLEMMSSECKISTYDSVNGNPEHLFNQFTSSIKDTYYPTWKEAFADFILKIRYVLKNNLKRPLED